MLLACPVRLFGDRRDAGRRLARALGHLRGFDVVVVGLPRGGVPVADEVARALDAPLDVVLVRKLGAPFQREYAIGAIGEDGALFVNERALALLDLSRDELMRIALRERVELERLSGLYRGEREPLPVEGRTVILVDDGIATGLSARAAARAVRARGARRIVLAVPVAPPDQRDRFMGVVDEFVCLEQPEGFVAVGAYYEEFGATSDEEVEACLRHARELMQALDDSAVGDDPPPRVGGGLDLARVAPARRAASRSMSKTFERSRVSSSVSRSNSSVARPALCRLDATNRLRGLRRLEPLPCAKITSPRAAGGAWRSPVSSTPAAPMRT
jgi:putative phosphoribosyl transferase